MLCFAPHSSNVIYGDQREFPVYQPDPEVLAARAAAFAAAANAPLVDHYDASTENRSRGAGFMQFSQDEETRKREMDALKAERERTERSRAEVQQGGGINGEREKEKLARKRKIELKRQEMEEKRRKVVVESPAK